MATIEDLPLEILGLCFLPLSFPDRLRPSHVSRRWRSAASDPAVWSQLRFDHKPHHHDTFLVALARSAEVPLCALWTSARLSGEPGFDLLEAHMSRVRTLSLVQPGCTPFYEDLPVRLFNAPATLLEEFNFQANSSVILPAQWSGSGAPRLHTIRVSYFSFAPACAQFRSLRRFRGSLGRTLVDPVTLFELFPGLVDLELCEVTDEIVRRLNEIQIPPGLSRLSLLYALRPIDYRPFLTSVAATIRFLSLSGAADVLSSLKHYTSCVSGLFSMTCRIFRFDGIHYNDEPSDFDRLFENSGLSAFRYSSADESHVDSFDISLHDGGSFTLNCQTHARTLALDSTPTLVPHLRNLAHLNCAAAFFARLLRTNATLPSLQSLTLLVYGMRPFGGLASCDFQRRGHVRVPQLRALTVDTTGGIWNYGAVAPNWFFATFPATVSAWLQFDEPKLRLARLFVDRDRPFEHRASRAVALLSKVEKAFIGSRADGGKGLIEQGMWYLAGPECEPS
ncbi:hypothetical protein AURDEDRAFT_172451 [Auricularia subglabra TFB-10046 SS5]|nr:hypothetical protein AURDEDRAFT_172451 [Auricularia subglabra TFB-10046 SS5]